MLSIPPAADRTPSCPSCGSPHTDCWGECRPYASRDADALRNAGVTELTPGRLYRCRDCRLGYRWPCLLPDQIQILCENGEAHKSTPAPTRRTAWRIALSLVERMFDGPSKVNVLDIGCSDGQFLDLLPARCARFAIEPNSEAHRTVVQRAVTVVRNWLGPAEPPWRESMDVVTLFDVFEHLHDPAEGLRNALSYLKPGGHLLVCTGDMDAWNWRLLRGYHWYLDPAQHVTFASKGFVRTFCAQTDTKLVGAYRVCHTSANTGKRAREMLATWYFILRRRRGIFRGAQVALQSVPRLRWLMHQALPPYTQSLKDHTFFHVLNSARCSYAAKPLRHSVPTLGPRNWKQC